MSRKYLNFILFFILLFLAGAGAFYLSGSWEKDEDLEESKTQEIQSLKLITSHSSPETGEQWIVLFKTIGTGDLTITPKDQDTINDLDFVSLACDSEEKKEALQVLDMNIIFYPGWQCDGLGEIRHLVNVARKHMLEFRFRNKIAFAYNNPDSVTDTFDDESKVSATSSVVVSGGEAQLATCADSGDACSGDGDCCSGLHCQNSVCCATGQTCCSSDDPCGADSNINNCQYTNNYCDTVTDYYCKSSTETCGANQATKGATSCTAVTTSNYCQYLDNACDGLCQKRRNYYGCAASGSTCEGTARAYTDTNCPAFDKCSGGTCIDGDCATCYSCDAGSCSWALTSVCGSGLYGCPSYGQINRTTWRYKKCSSGVCEYDDCDYL